MVFQAFSCRFLKKPEQFGLSRILSIWNCCGPVKTRKTRFQKITFFVISKFFFSYSVRKNVTEWLELHRRVPSLERDKEITARIIALSRFLPEPLKSQEFLARFSKHMLKDPTLLLGWYICFESTDRHAGIGMIIFC